MSLRPAVPTALPAGLAVVTLLLASAAPAVADAPVPAAGEAVSALTLLTATAGSTALEVGGLELVTRSTGAAPEAQVVVTPLVAGGTPHGRQVVSSGQTRTVDGLRSSSVAPGLAGLVDVTGPALEAGASVADGVARAGAGADSLGTVSLLGLPVRASGSLVGAATTGAEGSATKVLELGEVALPSVADLLAALGLDLSRLPVSVLRDLVTQLDLLTPAITSADAALAQVQAQVDAAQAEVDEQVAAVAAATRQLTAATAALPALEAAVAERKAAAEAAAAAVTAAQTELDRATRAAAGPVGGVPLVGQALVDADAAVQAATAALSSAATRLATATTAQQAAEAALAAGQAAVATAQAAVDAAQRLLDAARALLAPLLPQVQALVGAILAVLDETPLVSLDGLTVATEAVARGAGEGEQRATVTGGEVRGLEVLGTDVLSDVLGRRTLELTGASDEVLSTVAVAIDELTGTLSDVLSAVPGLPTLEVPAPQVDLLVKDSATGVDGLFGTASTSIVGLQVTLPAITLPAAVALPDALSLPGLSVLPSAALPLGTSRLTAGDVLTSTATTLGFGTATEAVRFRAASADAPVVVTDPTADPTADPASPTGDPSTVVPVAAPESLPRTGASDALALVALGLVGTALYLRRREISLQ